MLQLWRKHVSIAAAFQHMLDPLERPERFSHGQHVGRHRLHFGIEFDQFATGGFSSPFILPFLLSPFRASPSFISLCPHILPYDLSLSSISFSFSFSLSSLTLPLYPALSLSHPLFTAPPSLTSSFFHLIEIRSGSSIESPEMPLTPPS